MSDGKRLKKMIEERGLSFKWVAKKLLNPPVDVTTINRWLNHKGTPGGLYGFGHRDQLSKFFKTSFWGGSID